MVKYIVLSFLFMGWAFYELSGGSDFDPAAQKLSEPTPAAANPAAAADVTVAELAPAQEPASAATTFAPQQDDAVVTLASSVPTTRLVGAPKPTPTAERTKLGPSETVARADTSATKPVFSLAQESAGSIDFRIVTGTRVNMRNGPGTDYSVIATLVQDSQVEVLQDPGLGWVKLQVLESGRIGWMSAKLLAKIDE
ncbi:SH3 domain-containing protein [Cognatishimia sp. 1_MG-2023]|uniref:SH3 domain-containing protein n=1 Tax=Cognatishimia sp. 1_MG-2023 TaxID=3062642 RepID=UPI0026E28A9D|nr:SH3 domain-containing protein [Cognatishimia sp. 1_MG-2023]MDO6727797.1 SH3 domain-containing protein [Cognatishimia sp. 1_MG-2023]